jgi:hypothetical protein
VRICHGRIAISRSPWTSSGPSAWPSCRQELVGSSSNVVAAPFLARRWSSCATLSQCHAPRLCGSCGWATGCASVWARWFRVSLDIIGGTLWPSDPNERWEWRVIPVPIDAHPRHYESASWNRVAVPRRMTRAPHTHTPTVGHIVQQRNNISSGPHSVYSLSTAFTVKSSFLAEFIAD